MDEQERQWVRQARQGDREAFAALVDSHWERLRRWLYGLTGQAQLAEDLTQDAFLKAWTSLPKLAADGTFRVWLFRIARNGWLDSQRGPRGQRPHNLPEGLPGQEVSPLNGLLEAEAHDQLQAALRRLPETYRSAYLLWSQQELPYSDIAQVLNISEVTARWRVCKARQFLVQELSAYLDDPTP